MGARNGRRKTWIKVPPGRYLMEAPSPGGVEHHEVSVIEPPVCCDDTPRLSDPEDVEGPRTCDPCGAEWFP